MKFLMLAFLVLAGCSSGSSGGGQPGPVAYSGKPDALNGMWVGNGEVTHGNQPKEYVSATMIVSRLPTGFDLSIETFDDQGAKQMETSLTGHRVLNNQIIDVRDNANVGSAGQQGFKIGRPNLGSIDATLTTAGDLVVHAVTDYGSGYLVVYDVTLKKRGN